VSHPNGELLAVEMTMQRLQTDHSFPSHRPGSGDLLLATLASVMKFFTRRWVTASALPVAAQGLHRRMHSEAEAHVPWVALVGRREDGRGRAAERVVERLRELDVPLGGFLQRPVFSSDAPADEAVAYEAENLRSGERIMVATHGEDPAICD